jgi:hypothetical protein
MRALRAAAPGTESVAEAAARAVEFTDELLDGARAIATESADESLARRLDDAARTQESAKRALHDGEFEQATKLTTRSRDSVRDAIGKVEAQLEPSAVETALARTDEAIAKVRDRLSDADDAEARALLERAQSRQSEARDAFASNEPRRALALPRVAHTLAAQALRRVGDVGR